MSAYTKNCQSWPYKLPHASGTVHYSAKFQAYIWKPKVTLSKPIMENLKFLQNVQKLANHGHLIQESTS